MERTTFSIENIRKMSEEMSKNNLVPYEDLPRYDLFLSQVIDYLNDKFPSDKYTSTIVQNYIKGEVISKPVASKKRGYTKSHLAQLLLLSYMRPVLSTEDIGKVFRLVFNEINDKGDDIISLEKTYEIFSNIQKDSFSKFLKEDYFSETRFNKLIEDNNLAEREQERILVFLIVISLIAQASTIKKLVQKIIEDFNNLDLH